LKQKNPIFPSKDHTFWCWVRPVCHSSTKMLYSLTTFYCCLRIALLETFQLAAMIMDGPENAIFCQ